MTHLTSSPLVWFAFAACFVGCGDAGDTYPPVGVDDAGETFDGGMAPEDVGAGADGGPESSPQGLRADPSRVAGEADPDVGLDANDYVLTCADGEDNDGSGIIDCEDARCASLGYCCTGNGDCCTDTSVGTMDLTLCGADLGSCAPTATPFGLGLETTAEGLVMRGDAFGEGGALFGAPIDLTTQRVELSATISPPQTCGSDCLETTVLGLVSNLPETGAGVLADSEVALVYSGSQSRLMLLVGGREQGRHDVPRTDDFTVGLIVRPTGDVSVVLGSDTFDYETVFLPSETGLARVALYGRARNTDAGSLSPARVRALSTRLSLCDIPTAWSERSVLAEGETPTVHSAGGEVRVAWMQNDVVQLGRIEGETLVVGETVRPLGDETFEDPELDHDGTNWHLYLTVRRADGSPTIERMPAEGDSFGNVGTVVLRDAFEPVVARTEGGLFVMAAQTSAGWTVYQEGGSVLPGADLHVPTSRDGESVGGLALSAHNGAWHLHVAYRRGTRTSLRLFVSDALVVWRDLGEVLSGSGQGFDALGVTAPASTSTPEGLRLLYVGDDGMGARVGTTFRVAATEAGII